MKKPFPWLRPFDNAETDAPATGGDAAEPPARVRYSSGTRRKPRVLLAESHTEIRECYAWCMRAVGWVVDEAASGGEALLLVATFAPDVIVLDLGLRGLDGYEMIRRLKRHEETCHIPVVACASGDRPARAHAEALARRAGCDAFMPKLRSPDGLRALLITLVERDQPPPERAR